MWTGLPYFPSNRDTANNLWYCNQFKTLPVPSKGSCYERWLQSLTGLTTYKSQVNNSVTSRSLETHETNFRNHVKISAETDVRAAKTSERYFYAEIKRKVAVSKKLNRSYFTQILLNCQNVFVPCQRSWIRWSETAWTQWHHRFLLLFCPAREQSAVHAGQLSPRSEFPTRAKPTDGNTTRDMLVRFFVWKWRMKYSREVCHVLEQVQEGNVRPRGIVGLAN